MKKHVSFLLICFAVILAVASIGQAQKKITGPWLWMTTPAGPIGGAVMTDVDTLSKASGGSVTQEGVAKNGVKAGQACGKLNWTWGEIAATGGNNVNDLMVKIGLGTGDIDQTDGWAYIELDAAAKKGVTAKAGSDDSIKVWLNGNSLVVMVNGPLQLSHFFQNIAEVAVRFSKNGFAFQGPGDEVKGNIIFSYLICNQTKQM